MSRISSGLFLLMWCGAVLEARAADEVRVPLPVKKYAQQFALECQSNGLGELIVTDNYTDKLRGLVDVNKDGQRDYIVYKCMFGCSEKPHAFTGRLTPCSWGTLLLSKDGSYQQVFLPGMVSKVHAGGTLMIEVQKPRALRLIGNFCSDGFGEYDPQYVYVFKQERFQLVGLCPQTGCKTLLSQSENMSVP